MRWFGNLVHLLTGGLILASAWLVAAVLVYVFPETRRLARPCLQIARFHLSHRGRELVRGSELAAYREYVRTGRLAAPLPAGRKLDRQRLSMLIVWAPFGLVLAAGHLVHSLLFAALRLSSPWRSASFSALPACLCPHDWQMADSCGARTRLLASSCQGLPTLKRTPPAVSSASGFSPKLVGAAIVLCASISTNGSLLLSPSEVLGDPAIPAGSAQYPPGSATAATGPISRPVAMPPLTVGGASRAVAIAPPCGTPALHKISSRLSRRHPDFALPLGSSQVAPGADFFMLAPVDRLERLTRLSASVKNARSSRQPCAQVVAKYAIRSSMYAADRAAFFRLAAKAEPEHFRGGRIVVVAAQKDAAYRHLSKVQRLLASLSPGKAPNAGSPEDMAERIARAAAIL